MLSNTADDGTVFQSVGNLEFQQLLHLRYAFAFQYSTYTDVEFLKFFESNGRFNRISLVIGCFVGLLGGQQFIYLCLNDVVFNLFEQQFRLVQLMAFCQQVCTSQLFPVEAFHV